MSGSEAPVGTLRKAVRAARRRAHAVRLWLRRARLDLDDRRRGTRDPLLPPRRLGLPSNTPAVGEALADLLSSDGGLDADGSVLDIGCGPGRVAAPLTRRLGPEARYEGFDVMPRSIRWCRKAISSRHPNFRFQLADLQNGQYNPNGKATAADYRFPYEDDGFDAALATSLFTHLRPFESEHYLEETRRVLRPGGRLLGTWFLYDEEVARRIAAGEITRPGMFDTTPLELHELSDARGNPYRAMREDVPEYMIVIDLDEVRALHERAGMRIVEIRHGRWAGRGGDQKVMGQDLVIAEPASGSG